MMQTFAKIGLDALLTPENCVVLLIDHQPFQLANVNSHDPTIVIYNVTALAKTAKAFGIPTILSTVNEERGGALFSSLFWMTTADAGPLSIALPGARAFPESITSTSDGTLFIGRLGEGGVVRANPRTGAVALFVSPSMRAVRSM